MASEDITRELYSYWGKATPADGSLHGWHPLVYHSLDVAACGAEFLCRRPATLRALAEGTGLTSAETRSFSLWMIALHDLGKFSDRFQWQVPELAEALHPSWSARPYTIRHDSMGYELLGVLTQRIAESPDLLHDPDLDRRDLEDLLGVWFQAVTGHHGTPPMRKGMAPEVFLDENTAAALAYAEIALKLFGPVRVPPWSAEPAMKRASWLLAGISVLADWIGSDQTHFPYETGTMPLIEYWTRAKRQAQVAIEEAGVIPNAGVRTSEQKQLFPFIVLPTPAQEYAATFELPERPSLLIVEDVTGSGKTEAGLTIAARLMEHGHSDGIYVALPTMATANGMFPRILAFGLALFPDGDFSLLLSHGGRRLFRTLREAPSDCDYSEPDEDNDQTEISATSHARAWLSDTSKKALLSQFGVGTVDQALLGVLPAKFSPLRLAGLFRKVLVVDEVHAYDTYTSKILENLLRFHAHLGGHTVLLSATLPESSRRSLVAAFREGARYPSTDAPDDDKAYPLVTEVRETGTRYLPLAPARSSERVVRTRFIHTEDEAVAVLREAAVRGGCAAWIRNTIDNAARGLSLCGEEIAAEPPTLFHSRFMAGDRARIETEVLGHFGKSSGMRTRAGRIVCATQVLEQSLDLDFDAMVSDLAPIDLLLQRAGRLHRHCRDREGNRSEVEGRDPPTLYVLAPQWTDAPDASWLDYEPLGASKYVYSRSVILWRTMQVLQDRGGLHTPQDSRDLIESVYADGLQVPPGLVADDLQIEGQRASERSLARMNQLILNGGYTHRGDTWLPETRTPTRLGDQTTILRLAKIVDGMLCPAFEPEQDMRWAAWELSEVRVPLSRIAAPQVPETLRSQVDALQHDARFACVVPVLLHGDKLYGRGSTQEGRDVRFSYSSLYGLHFEEAA